MPFESLTLRHPMIWFFLKDGRKFSDSSWLHPGQLFVWCAVTLSKGYHIEMQCLQCFYLNLTCFSYLKRDSWTCKGHKTRYREDDSAKSARVGVVSIIMMLLLYAYSLIFSDQVQTRIMQRPLKPKDTTYIRLYLSKLTESSQPSSLHTSVHTWSQPQRKQGVWYATNGEDKVELSDGGKISFPDLAGAQPRQQRASVTHGENNPGSPTGNYCMQSRYSADTQTGSNHPS